MPKQWDVNGDTFQVSRYSIKNKHLGACPGFARAPIDSGNETVVPVRDVIGRAAKRKPSNLRKGCPKKAPEAIFEGALAGGARAGRPDYAKGLRKANERMGSDANYGDGILISSRPSSLARVDEGQTVGG